MKTNTFAALALGAMLVPVFSAAHAQDKVPSGAYGFDPDHSAIMFEYDHMGFSTSYGLVRGVSGTIQLDADNPENSTVEASFPISHIVTVAAELDGHIRGAEMFNSPDGSQMVTFKSTKVVMDDDDWDEAKVTGDLTMNGVTKSVVLDVDLEKAGNHPMTNKPTLGFEAETEIMRSDFNLGLFAPAVADKVKIELSVEAMLAD